MLNLALPAFDYKIRKQNGTPMIFDVIRKKYVVLTPEEWVRQHLLHYLMEVKHYPPALIAVEKEISLYGLRQRFDVVCYNRQSEPYLIVECKAPAVVLSRKVFDQVFRYNLVLAAPYIAVTNGINHYCGYLSENKTFSFLADFPDFVCDSWGRGI